MSSSATGADTHLLDGELAVDSNHLENFMRQWAMGHRAWLFNGSELAGQPAAFATSLVQSAKLCGHERHAYLEDELERLPTHKPSRFEELPPHRWSPAC